MTTTSDTSDSTDTGTADDTDTGNNTGDNPDSNGLAAAGRKALDAERRTRRDAEKRAKDLETRLKAIEDRDKSETERLTETNAQLTRDLTAATVAGARMKVAFAKGLTANEAKRLIGDTEEDLAVDADEMLADRRADEQSRSGPPPGGRPREQLKPGNGDPDVPADDTDIRAIGERMFRH